MRSGIWVLNIFAAIWAAGGITIGHGPTWLAAVAVAISVGLLVWSNRQPLGIGNPVTGAHVGRVVGIATVVEFVAIFVAANVLVSLHQPTLILPIVAIFVGLHFVPIARWAPVPLYYRTAAGLIVVGLAALLLPSPARALTTGIAAAVVLWASAIALARQGRG